MHTISLTSRTQQGARSQPSSLLHRGALACSVALFLAAQATSQGTTPEPRPLDLQVSSNEQGFGTVLDMGPSGFVFLQCKTDSLQSGGWYGAVTHAYLDPGAQVTHSLLRESHSLSSFVDNPSYGWTVATPSLPANWTLNVDQAGGDEFFSKALTNGVTAVPNAVNLFLDPLFVPPSGQGITQIFGENPNAGWLRDDASGAFNADAMLQEAAWRRLGPLVGPMKSSDFFNSDEWQGYLNSGMQLAVTLIGIRGPDVAAGSGVSSGSGTPGLLGFPTNVPVYGISNEARLKFGGTGSYEFGYVYDPVNGMQQIFPAVPGGGVAMPSVGFSPKMQIKLFQNQAVGVEYTLTLHWATYGYTAFRVPLAAAQGPHSVREYRFYQGDVNGVPTYGAWQIIPAGGRPMVIVQ